VGSDYWRLDRFVSFALYFALIMLVAGFFVLPENSKYHTAIYLGFYGPALAAVLLNFRSLKNDLASDPALQCFSLLMIWLGITTLWTPYEDIAHLVKLLLMLWILVLSVRLMLENMRYFTNALTVSLAMVAVVVIATLVEYLRTNGADFYTTRLGLIGGRAIAAPTVGQIFAIFMMFCLMQARLAQTAWRGAGYAVMAIIFMLPLVLSFSRTAFVALLLTSSWYYLQRGNIKVMLTMAGITGLFFGVILIDIDSLLHTNLSRIDSIEIRLWGWKATWKLIQEHWLLGYGIRAPLNVSWLNTPYAETGMDFYHPHNLFLSIWHQAGLVGLSLTLAMLALIARKLRARFFVPEVRYWSCIFLFVLLVCLVDSPGLIDRPAEPWIWFWLPLAVALNADKLTSNPADSGIDDTTSSAGAQ
jgi:O-antigen ligase